MLRRLYLSFLVLAVPTLNACLQPEAVTCGDSGVVCPPGWVCIADRSACIDPNAPERANCGNNVVDEGEECDDGNLLNHDGCNWDCQTPRCGDGFLDAPEVCDDGNTSNGDGCSNNCTSIEVCGDGIVNPTPHPARDEDGNIVRNGNDIVFVPAEGCDSNGIDTDECNADCTVARCGDAKVNPAHGEACDGGDDDNPNDDVARFTATCDSDCSLVACGDALTNPQVEFCDEGKFCTDLTTTCESNEDCSGIGDGTCSTRDINCCTRDCKAPGCGDGYTERDACGGRNPEVCDDGKHCADGRTPCQADVDCANVVLDPGVTDRTCAPRNGTGCSALCNSNETCGDEVLNNYAPVNEICDNGSHCIDGTTPCETPADCDEFDDTSCAPRDGDGCNGNCRSVEVCGDGILNNYPRRREDGSVEDPEVCDDGRHCENGTPCTTAAECAGIGDGACEPRNADGCSADCFSVEVCGDGIVNDYDHLVTNLRAIVGVPTIAVPFLGREVCDNGKHCSDGTECESDVDCADVADLDKRCVPRNGDGCSADCLSAETCGDGYFNDYDRIVDGVQVRAEVCDDRNTRDGDGCNATCSSSGICGNGILDPGELCDFESFNGLGVPPPADAFFCRSAQNPSGQDCTKVCNGQTSGRGCTFNECGNGVRDPGEACDDGRHCLGSGGACQSDIDCIGEGPGACQQRNEDDCTNTCDLNICGDLIINVNLNAQGRQKEPCDDGAINTEDCNFDCTTPTCGDNITNTIAGETCDAGAGAVEGQSRETTSCNTNCQVALCGDTVVNRTRGEVCDDGNFDDGDGCAGNCRSVELCGDGVVNSYPHIDEFGNPLPPEVCDNGKNCSNGDVCTSDDDCGGVAGDCQARGGDGCSPDCLSIELCGDSYISNYAPLNESCDDGNDNSDDGCSGDVCAVETGWSCPAPGVACFEVCGDGLIVGDETCDNGGLCTDNTTVCDSDADCGGAPGSCTPRAGDGCSVTCQTDLGWSCPNNDGVGGSCAPICGDFLIRGTETCDDGNTTAGDGCTSSCAGESGWNCPTANNIGGVCLPVCGDGVVAGTEECDDGGFCGNSGIACDSNDDCVGQGPNSVCTARSDDGCSAICRVELGYECPESNGNPVGGACNTDCGDFLIRGDEDCDDGNQTSNDGCSATCQFEDGWTCPAGFEVIGGECRPICGDGLVRGSESCDDNDQTSGDGCDTGCKAETGWTCPTSGGTGGNCTPTCGDGLLRGTESCDEGTNTASGGCNSCVRQDGWSCPSAGGVGGLCTTICGDGKVRGAETCDDTNLVSNDGCSSTCAAEGGWTCPTSGGNGGACTTNCGDGLIRGAETCDEGSNPASGGCLSCAAQSGWSCPTSGGNGGVCTTICGDRLVRGAETCDDGNEVTTDGCNACAVQTGWYCPTAGGVGGNCATECGDGLRAGAETCDDDDTESGDGCDSGCRIETGWSCPTPGQACTPVCGDGLVRGTETCDDSGRCSNNNAVCTTSAQCPSQAACNPASSDGCSASCQTEVGWTCPLSGGACSTPAPVAADDTVTILSGQASYQFVISSLLTNDTNVHAPSFSLTSATTSCGGSVTSNGTNVTFTPAGAPSCGNPQADTFTYQGCSQYNPALCDTATVTVAINRPPVLADATSCVPLGTAQATVNFSTIYTDPDNNAVNLSSLQATQPANTTVGVSGTLATMTASNPATAATYTSTLTAGDSGTPPGTDTGTWTVQWNDVPVLNSLLTSTPTVAPKGSTTDTLITAIITSPGTVPTVNLADPTKAWIATTIQTVRVSATENGTFSTSITTAGGNTCSVDATKVSLAVPANAPNGSDACWVRVCEVCNGGNVCSTVRVNYNVVACQDTAAGTSQDLGCSALTPICHTSHPSGPTCVECVSNAQCPSNEPVCSPATFECDTCSNSAAAGQVDDGCADPLPACQTSSPKGCYECLATADCGRRGDAYDTCDTTNRVCGECNANGDCAAGFFCVTENISGTNRKICVDCRTNADCGANEVCNPTTDTCVACVGDSDCSDTPSTPACSASNTCVQCTDNTDCSGGTPVCKTATNTCVECAAGVGCSNGEFCNEGTNLCAGCLDNDDCTANANGEVCLVSGACGCETTADCAGAEVCDTGLDTCVLCIDSAAGNTQDSGCTALTPVCIGTGGAAACVECNSDTHCDAGWTCTSNVCEPPPVAANNDTVGFLIGAGAPLFDLDDLLLNDDNADETSFTLVSGSTVCGGTIGFIEVSGTFTYTAPADPASCAVAYTDSFTYEVCNTDDPADCDEAVVTILLNRAPTVTDTSTCVAVNTASLMLDVSTLYTDPDSDLIGSVTVTGQPSGGTVGVANTDELTLTPTNAAAAATFTTTFDTCDTRAASPWHPGCDSAIWTAQWNDAPTLTDLATTPAEIAWTEALEYTQAQIVTTFGTVANSLASMTVSDTVGGTYDVTATATFGGTCAIVDGNKLRYTAPASGVGNASCFVKVCETCGATPTCTTAEVKFAVAQCVVDAGTPDRGCSEALPVCDGTRVCVAGP